MFARLIVLFVLFVEICSFNIDLTFQVAPHAEECFHQPIEIGTPIEIQYEVLRGGSFDINFYFYSPSNELLQNDFGKSAEFHTTKVEQTGDFRFCFENSMSTFDEKLVAFSVRSTNANQPEFVPSLEKDELGDLQEKSQQIQVKIELPLLVRSMKNGVTLVLDSHSDKWNVVGFRLS